MTAATAQDHDDSILAAEYVLRLLGMDQEKAVERRLRDDRALESEVGRWVRYFAPMADEIAPVKPPRRTKDRLMTALFDAPAQNDTLFSLRALVQGVGFAGVAALAVVVAMPYLTPPAVDVTAPQPTYMTEVASEDSALRVLAVYDGTQGALKISRTAGAAVPGRVLELWAIVGDNAPVSLGVLPDEVLTTVALPAELAPALPQLILAISDEPPGGSPTGQPTGAVLAVGAVTEI